jgi:hypothetical protein
MRSSVATVVVGAQIAVQGVLSGVVMVLWGGMKAADAGAMLNSIRPIRMRLANWKSLVMISPFRV